MEGKKLWNIILANVKAQISASSFRTWFAGSFVLDYQKSGTKNLLIIAVKNNFLKEQIETRYLPIISQVNKKENLSNLEFAFVVASREDSRPENRPIFSGVAPQIKSSPNGTQTLNNSHTFDNFIVGSSNNLAYFAASQVATGLGSSYNPLMFYGPTGVGKTHLLQAIGNDVLNKIVDTKILYVTAEKFTNDYIESLNNKTQAAFRQKYRSVDLLLVDDIQFLAGKESTQDEFFYTFNDLFLKHKQVVLACDRHPKGLGKLKDRLVSRFLGGMAADMGLPDLEMRVAILKSKCRERGVELDDEIISFLASSYVDNPRELEGLLIQVLALIKLSSGKISLAEIAQAVDKNKKSTTSTKTPTEIIGIICGYFGVKPNELTGASRRASLVFARQVLMYFLRQNLRIPLGQVGFLVGGRDHSTVIHGIAKIQKMVAEDKTRGEEIMKIHSLVSAEKQGRPFST